MNRPSLIILAGLLLAAAAPRHAPAVSLPPPPPLPIDPPTDRAAPVPDAPSSLADRAAPETAFALRIYRMRDFGTGEGYIPGSAYQSPEQRKPMQTPGFMVTVPLR